MEPILDPEREKGRAKALAYHRRQATWAEAMIDGLHSRGWWALCCLRIAIWSPVRMTCERAYMVWLGIRYGFWC